MKVLLNYDVVNGDITDRNNVVIGNHIGLMFLDENNKFREYDTSKLEFKDLLSNCDFNNN